MSSEEHTLSLSEEELERLNQRHIGGTDKWLRMFMGIASEITKVEEGIIYLQVVYSKKAKQSKAKIVARTWLKSPKNSFLLEADNIVVTEYTDRGKPGDFVILEEGMRQEEAIEKLDAEETERFGETKQFIRQQIFSIERLLEEDDLERNGPDFSF